MILLYIFLALGGLVLILGILGFFLVSARRRALATSRPYGPAATASFSISPTAPLSSRTASLPPVTRRVPHHALSLLDGCTADDMTALADGIDGAISVGAPLYNSGDFAGCYHLYEGTAADIERKLTSGCSGPSRALESGRTRAASLSGPSAQAWAMRDAFDGLLDVIERSGR